MLRETAIISVWVLLIAVYFTKNNIYSIYNDLKDDEPTKKMFTESSLSEYDGKSSPDLYLSILGKVFDVTKGVKHYGPKGSYYFFIGKDATRSFVNGDFECKKNCDNISGLNPQELRSLDNWVKFYEKNYKQLGKLIGKYYKQDGTLTPYAEEMYKLINKALEEETEEDRIKLKYPECNLEWDLERGTHVWCSDQSGGIKRNWIGVPRKLFSPGSDKHRCACINNKDLKGANLKEYEGCDPKSNECYFKQ